MNCRMIQPKNQLIFGIEIKKESIKRETIESFLRCHCSPHIMAIFLAHLSQRLMGELVVYQSLRSPSVVRRPSSVRPQFQTSSLNELKFHMETPLFKWSWSHDQDGRHAHIW